MHVCLIAEGSYPYVTGGVGKWTHDLIAALPEVQFTVISLWPSPDPAPVARYPKLPNLREMRTSYVLTSSAGHCPVSKKEFARIEDFHHGVKKGEVGGFAKMDAQVGASCMRDNPEAWNLVTRLYQEYAPANTSFPDYFWTWQATHLPLFNILSSQLCKADLYHCISTGYAGILAALHKTKFKAPLVTTEHGLYTRERAQEIWDADWIPGEKEADARRSGNFFKGWWNRMFRGMERITYGSSDCVIALFEDNRKYQIDHGAPERLTRVIPNGIDLRLFDEVRKKRHASGKYHIGLVGRVVPIKDIKTFLGACRIVVDQMKPEALQISVIGPMDEDKLYAAQCVEMVQAMGLEKIVKLVGKTDPKPYYETLDVAVLTSLSEGQPLVVLEAMACGIPLVATDVGSCRELLEGRTEEDRALGTAGLVTPIADPQETARALVRLGTAKDETRAMGEAGRRRVEKYYRIDQVRGAYLDLYRSLVNGRS